MNQNALYYLKIGSLILLGIIILGYSFFQTRHIIFGPEIDLVSPIDGETYTNPLLEIKGMATNVSSLTLDDTPLLTDTHGNFDQKLLLAPGYTILRFVGADQFGKTTVKIVQVILKENQLDILPKNVATSTAVKLQSAGATATSSKN